MRTAFIVWDRIEICPRLTRMLVRMAHDSKAERFQPTFLLRRQCGWVMPILLTL